MQHILDLEIESFRGLKNLKIEKAGSVNILVGGNNTGKTSVLEAIELLCHPLNINQFFSTSRGRDRSNILRLGDTRMPLEESVEWLFPLQSVHDLETKEIRFYHDPVHLEANIHRKKHTYIISFDETRVIEEIYSVENMSLEQDEVRALEVHMEHMTEGTSEKLTFLTVDFPRVLRGEPKFELSTRMVTPVDHRLLPFSAKSLTESFQADKSGLIQLLQLFDSNIIDIELLSPTGQNAIPYLLHRYKSYIPVSVFGDGMRRVLTLASEVIRSKRGILLIDEIETAIHPRMLTRVFTWLMDACQQYEVQLFATTHSLETVDAILNPFVGVDLETEEVDLTQLQHVVGYRLIQEKDQTLSKRFAGQELYQLRNEYGQDVR